MRVKHYLFIATLCTATLFGCSKSKDEVVPDTANLLIRKWSFTDISVKTDAKTYAIPSSDDATFFGEDNTVTFNENNTYSTVEDGQIKDAGTWKLSSDNKTLTLTDADKIAINMTINSITSTNLEITSSNVNITKDNPTLEEMGVALAAELLLYTLDIDAGGTVDFSKEPEPKSYQLLLKGKAL